ncbi:hypothetical protein IWW50_004397 [Coemansia erecta]|nr:hypothetical protein IWW50_004397 [Coemansia erecta]
MDESEISRRNLRRQNTDDFETPMGVPRDRELHGLGADSDFGLDAGRYATGTPASRVAAGAVGRRLDLAPPQFALHQPPAGRILSDGMDGPSAFATPVVQQPQLSNDWSYQTPPELGAQKPAPHIHGEPDDDWSPAAVGSMMTPPGQFSGSSNSIIQQQGIDGPPTPFGAQPNVVDQDFILNLNQEGDLERLTRKAEADIKGAWKQLTMDALKRQVASLEDDKWMFCS